MNRLLSVLVLSLLLLAGGALAQQTEYEVSATVPVGQDAARAREQALKEAMQHAVEEAVRQAAPEARGRLYLVSARARDYVVTYRMLEEGETAGSFRVRVAAQVDLPRLLSDLQVGGGGRRPTQRSVLRLCLGGEDAALRAALLPALSSWEVLPPGPCPEGGTGGTPALFVTTTLAGEAPVPIRGTQPSLHGVLVKGHASLVVPGGLPVVEDEEVAGLGESPEAAARNGRLLSAQKVLTRLFPRLAALLPVDTEDGILVTLEGVGGYADYQRLLKTLSAMPGVKKAEPRRFAGDGADSKVEVLLHTEGAAEPLGAALGRTPVPGLRLQVVPEGPARLRVLVVAESALPAVPAAPADDPARPTQP